MIFFFKNEKIKNANSIIKICAKNPIHIKKKMNMIEEALTTQAKEIKEICRDVDMEMKCIHDLGNKFTDISLNEFQENLEKFKQNLLRSKRKLGELENKPLKAWYAAVKPQKKKMKPCFPQEISRHLTLTEAHGFLSSIKETCPISVYNNVIDTVLRYNHKSVDYEQLCENLKTLLKDYPALYNTFLEFVPCDNDDVAK